MKILAFETSCDDTSVALFENDILLAMHTSSQIKIHNKTLGVVPEVAAREHANNIFYVLDTVLNKAHIPLEEIDYIAVTTHPGLLPSLLTGITVANTLAILLKKKLIPIHHIEAHIFANYLERKESDILYPLVCLTASGGHNDIYYMKNILYIEKIGSSQDDAGGEAFDKVAKMMGFGYPGGPIISKLSSQYEYEDGKEIGLFPRVRLKKNEFNFSFSGLKTAVKREIEKRQSIKKVLDMEDKKQIAYEFEKAVVEVMSYKIINAGKVKGVKTILLAGGVSANKRLQHCTQNLADKEGIKLLYPINVIYSTDNAAMIGINAYYKLKYIRNL